MRFKRTLFPDDQVNVRVQANSSYQIKRAMEVYEHDKGLELMTISGILRNSGPGPRLREFATFKDLKYEKNQQRRKQKNQKNNNHNNKRNQ